MEDNKPVEYSKVIVGICLVTVIVFTIACFIYAWYGKSIDSTLTLCFFGCFGIEFASLAAIKHSKNKYDIKKSNKGMQMPKIDTEE
jgi:hypothetical protein|nr:MAG TPA: hypothetical protein [Caudoviricetes sp.]